MRRIPHSALCPLSVIADDLANGRLVQLSDITVHHERGYYLAEQAGGTKASSAVRAFREWLLAQATGDPVPPPGNEAP